MRQYLMMRNRILFIRKNGTYAQYLCTLFHSSLIYGLRRTVRALLKAQAKVIPALWSGWVDGILGRRVG